jgi:hypothetical protein
VNDNDMLFVAQLKTIVNGVAAALGIGTALGFINFFVGIASAFWLLLQLYDYFKYDRPLKKSKFRQMKDFEATQLYDTAVSTKKPKSIVVTKEY